MTLMFCTKCFRNRASYPADPTCKQGGYCNWQPLLTPSPAQPRSPADTHQRASCDECNYYQTINLNSPTGTRDSFCIHHAVGSRVVVSMSTPDWCPLPKPQPAQPRSPADTQASPPKRHSCQGEIWVRYVDFKAAQVRIIELSQLLENERQQSAKLRVESRTLQQSNWELSDGLECDEVRITKLSQLLENERRHSAELMARVNELTSTFNGRLVPADEPEAFIRASGDAVCSACFREYRKHPFSEHRDSNGEPFLNRLCSGQLVKL